MVYSLGWSWGYPTLAKNIAPVNAPFDTVPPPFAAFPVGR
jgi:hypothetical protein